MKNMEEPINRPAAVYPTATPNSNILHRSAFLRRVVALVVVPAAILAPTITIMWLVFRPEAPDFWLESFSLSNFTAVVSNNDRSNLSFASDVQLTSRNPNKRLALSYIHVDAFVFYKSRMISTAEVPPFSQGTKSDTRLVVNFSSARDSVKRLAVDGMNGSHVVLSLRILSRIRFEAKAWATRHRYLNVLCGDLVVGVPSVGRPGALTDGPRRCRVEI